MSAATVESSPAARPPAYTSITGASTYTSLSVRTIRELISRGRLPQHRVGARVLLAFDDLDRLVRGGLESSRA